MKMDEIRRSSSGAPKKWWLTLVLLACLSFSGPVWAQEEEAEEEPEASEEQVEAEDEGEDEGERQAEGPTPKLFMIPADSLQGEVTQIVTERINESTRRRLAAERNLDLVPSLLEILGAGGDDAYAVIAEAERQYTSGIGLLRAEEYSDAAETLQRAVTMMEENLAGLQNFNFLSDALSNLSLAYFHAGFDLDARQNMQKFAQLKPDATLDSENFPEDLRTVYADEVDRVQRAEAGVLNIGTDREGAQVFIDGVLKGAAPLVVEDVGFGYHYLVARDGQSVYSEVIRIRGRGQEQDFQLDFAGLGEEEGTREEPGYYVDLRGNLRSGRFGQNLNPYLTELTSQTGADFVAWVLIVREGAQYIAAPFVYRASDSMVIQGENVDFNLELSNLRSRVNRLSAVIARAVANMPEDMAVQDVDLAPEPEPVAQSPDAPGEGEEPVETEAEDESDEDQVAAADEHPTEPLPVPGASSPERGPIAELPDEEESNTLRYLGYGGAAVLAGGAIAGTIFLLVRSSASSGPSVFEAEVEW